MTQIDSRQLKTLGLRLLYFAAIWVLPLWVYHRFSQWIATTSEMLTTIRNEHYFLLDVCKFYVCGIMARSPEYLPNLYNPDVQASVFGKLLQCGTTFTWPNIPGQKIIFTPNEYTPSFDVLMIPGSYLSLRQFILVWELIIAATGLLLMVIVLKRQGLVTKWAALAWLLIVLCSFHLYSNVYLGQTALVVTALVGLFFVGLAEKRNWLMAIALNIIAIFKPQFTIVPCIAALCHRRFKALAIALVMGLMIIIGTAQVLGWQTIIDYPKNFGNIQAGTASGSYFYKTAGMGNLLSILIVLFGQKLAYKLSYPIMLAGWLGCILIWYRAAKVGKSTFRYAIAVTVPLALLTSAHANDFDLVILMVGWAFTVSAVSPAQIKLLSNKYERFWCYLFLAYPIVEQIMCMLRLIGGPYNIPVNLLVILSAYLLFRSKVAEAISSGQSNNFA
jgi:Glycosyltransferase family 87